MSSLYLEHFRLREPPFGITPNGRFFFEGRTHGAVLGALQHAVLDDEGIVVVVGEVGSGKTMLCRMLADRLPRDRVDLVYLANPSFGPQEILQSLVADWGLPLGPGQSPLQAIQAALIQRHAQGRRVVVLIDEAQAMPPESLEEIKLLSNLETAQHKLLQIVLFGQPELDEHLAMPRLRQVRDRVVHRFDLSPLDPDDAMAYVDHRMRRAGWTGGVLFEPKALRQLVAASGGRVRAIHLLADKALLAAFAQGAQQVSPRHIQRAIADVKGVTRVRDVGWNGHTILLSAVAVAAVLVVGMGVGYGVSPRKSAPPMVGAGQSAPLDAAAPTPTPTPTLASTSASAPTPSSVPAPAPIPAAVSAPPAVPEPSVPTGSPVPPLPVLPPSAPTPMQPVAPGDQATVPQALAERYAPLPMPLRGVVLETRRVLDDPSQQGWTLQLSIADTSTAAARLLSGLPDTPHVWVHDRHYPNRSAPCWAVYVGRYASRDEAVQALSALAAHPQAARPLIRTFRGIRTEAYPDRMPP